MEEDLWKKIVDPYDSQWGLTRKQLDKIKDAVRKLTILELENKKDSDEYKSLLKLIEDCEDEISEIWY